MFKSIRRLFQKLVYRLRANYTTEHLIKEGLEVGNNFLRMHDVIIDPSHVWLIKIGNNVTLAPRVHILAHDASLVNFLGYAKIGKVQIGNNVFIGADTVVLPNVRIGDNVVIGANSTVSRDIPSNSVAAGTPARVLGTIEDYLEKNRLLLKKRPVYDVNYTYRGKLDLEKKEKMKIELETGFGFVE